MKYNIKSGITILFILLASCKSDDINIDGPDGEDPEKLNYKELKSDYIFNDDVLHTFELNLPEASLQEINADPGAEQYVEGSLTFEGETVEKVGIRYKGSLGAFVDCVSGGIENGPVGSKTCTKLSMKVKFNWEETDDKFYGLKKLQFHSQRADDTQLKERLGYYLFRSMGVPAPRSVHARLVINGVYNGLFALTEQIDGRFTRLNFEDGENNLYKEIWPVDQFGETYAEQDYKNKLKTNEDENPSVALMMSFAEDIATTDQADMPELVNNWMDLDKIISYIVVDRTIKNDDGVFHWYCSDGWCSSHNYYWYEDVSRNKIHLIPWDLDNSFENIVEVENPWTQVVDPLGQITADCQPFEAGPLMQRSASCDKLIAGWASFTDELNQKKSQLINGPMAAANTNALIDKWSAQIREATIEARNLYDDAVSLERWEEQVADLRVKLEYARNN